MLCRQKHEFARAFYKRHRNHVVGVFVKVLLLVATIGAIASWGVSAYFRTGEAPYPTALFAAAFLYFLVSGILGIRDQFRVALLPYFSSRLGDARTFSRGNSLIWHSRQLDELAAKMAIQPLSDFASGDDMVFGERLRWFDPRPAHETICRLEQCQEAASFPEELKKDLSEIREALASACGKQTKFCFVVREGSFASGAEMDRRKGSFF
jgi:hypothetical protein